MNHKKEIFLAVFVGGIFGFLVAIFIWKSPFSITSKPQAPPAKETISPALPFSLTLTAPDDDLLTSESQATVSGQVKQAFLIVVTNDTEDQVIEPQDEGQFETKVSLEEGPNEIQVTAYGKDGQEVKESRIVNYLKE